MSQDPHRSPSGGMGVEVSKYYSFVRDIKKLEVGSILGWRKSQRKPEHSGVAEMSHVSYDGSKKKSNDLECVVEYIDGSCTTFFLPVVSCTI
nr:hypothetical transcript [Hymenolepis microstoma]